jgi:hypothetical protein
MHHDSWRDLRSTLGGVFVGKVISLLFPTSNQTLVHGGEGFEQQFVGGGGGVDLQRV